MIKRCPVLLQCNLKGSLNRFAGKSAKDWGSADLGVLDPVLSGNLVELQFARVRRGRIGGAPPPWVVWKITEGGWGFEKHHLWFLQI